MSYRRTVLLVTFYPLAMRPTLLRLAASLAVALALASCDGLDERPVEGPDSVEVGAQPTVSAALSHA